MIDMRSPRGFAAAIAFLLALPVAVAYQIVLGGDVEVAVHLICAAGFTLLSYSAFDFGSPRWIRWVGCVSSGALAVIYLLQGLSPLVQNDALTFLAFPVLGQWPERALTDLLLLWLAALALIEGRDKTKVMGIIVMSIVVFIEAYSIGLSFLGTSLYAEMPILKIAMLLPFVWLLLESRKSAAPGGSLQPATI
jgi:hypothetical protein